MADRDMVWNPQELIQQVENGNSRNLNRAATLLQTEVKLAISKRGAPITGKFRKNAKSTTGRRVQLREPSKPGEPPHKLTGRLYQGIKKKVKSKAGYARVTSIGGSVHEYGTSKEAPRPFLRVTLARLSSAIAAILTTPAN